MLCKIWTCEKLHILYYSPPSCCSSSHNSAQLSLLQAEESKPISPLLAENSLEHTKEQSVSFRDSHEAEWHLQTVQSELHTAAPLSGPERTHFLQRAGQAKEEVSEYIQLDLHFIF